MSLHIPIYGELATAQYSLKFQYRSTVVFSETFRIWTAERESLPFRPRFSYLNVSWAGTDLSASPYGHCREKKNAQHVWQR